MKISIFAFFIISATIVKAQKFGFFTDSRDGKKYKTVKIGYQVWMAENLNASKFRNGDPIAHVKDYDSWLDTETIKPAWDYQLSSPENIKRFGKLYNWYAVTDSRGLCPVGWVMPSFADFYDLFIGLGDNPSTEVMEAAVGNKIISKSFWNAVFGGTIIGLMEGGDMGSVGAWWTNTESEDHNFAIDIEIWNEKKRVRIEDNNQDKNNGLSVRCIKE